jgi:phenylacetate-CoA ligase
MSESLKKIPLLRKIRAVLPEGISPHYRDYTGFRESIRKSRDYTDSQWKEFQYSKLKELIHLCWDHIEGYRKHWEKAGFHPDHFKSPDDITRIPLITKNIIRQAPKAFINPLETRKFLHKSGGSTGVPFQFYEPVNARIIEKAFMHEIWSRFYPKISLKTRSTIIRGKIIKDEIRFDPMLGLILSSFNITVDNVKRFLNAMDKYKTPLLHAYPSSLYFVARIMKKYGMKPRHSFRAIMLGSEKLYDFQKDTIMEIFKAPVCHWYGQAEQVVLAGNKQDDHLFHTEPMYGYAEILTKEGKQAIAGESGEIIGTGFWNTVTPLIRYKTLDRAETESGFAGKGVLRTIHGRMQDVVVSKTGALLSLVGLAPVMAQFNEIENFRFVQEEPGKLQLIFIPAREGYQGPEQVARGVRNALGAGYEVDMKEVSEIQASPAGKNTFLEQRMDVARFY